MVEDRLLEFLQLPARVQAELAAQPRGTTTAPVERIGLPAAAVEGEHQPLEQVLPVRVFPDQPLELRNDAAMLAKFELRADARLERSQHELLERSCFALGPRLSTKVLERLAANRAESVAQEFHRLRRPYVRRRAHRCLEPVGVDLARLDAQRVASLEGLDAVVAERVAQGRHVALHALARRLRSVAVPDLLDQRAGGDGPAAREHEQRQNRALLHTSKSDLPLALD